MRGRGGAHEPRRLSGLFLIFIESGPGFSQNRFAIKTFGVGLLDPFGRDTGSGFLPALVFFIGKDVDVAACLHDEFPVLGLGAVKRVGEVGRRIRAAIVVDDLLQIVGQELLLRLPA